MSKAKLLIVKETIHELTLLRKKSSDTKNKRLLMLIEIKKEKNNAIAKRELARRIGVDPNSITSWKKLYEQSGIAGILADGRIGFKPSVVTAEEHKRIEHKLKDPQNGIRGYIELLDWIRAEFSKDMKYITLVKYAERHFGSKIKVARKSHIKKDAEAVETFKKTSVKNARKQP
jgi:transposase